MKKAAFMSSAQCPYLSFMFFINSVEYVAIEFVTYKVEKGVSP